MAIRTYAHIQTFCKSDVQEADLFFYNGTQSLSRKLFCVFPLLFSACISRPDGSDAEKYTALYLRVTIS